MFNMRDKKKFLKKYHQHISVNMHRFALSYSSMQGNMHKSINKDLGKYYTNASRFARIVKCMHAI